VGTVWDVTSDDPEKLLADALRAQARQAPADTSPVGYGLLSGSDLPPARPRGEDVTTTRVAEELEEPRQVPTLLILLLALLLGLASGAVVGLLTLL
jgi:hypothetical protein